MAGSSLNQRGDGSGAITTVRGLAAALGISKTEIGASLKRSMASGLAIKDRTTGRPKPNRRQLRDFIIHGLKFVFPAKPGTMQRGLPTAFAAPALKESLHRAGNLICVWWPSAHAKDMRQWSRPSSRARRRRSKTINGSTTQLL
jgi:hypothetical protein